MKVYNINFVAKISSSVSLDRGWVSCIRNNTLDFIEDVEFLVRMLLSYFFQGSIQTLMLMSLGLLSWNLGYYKLRLGKQNPQCLEWPYHRRLCELDSSPVLDVRGHELGLHKINKELVASSKIKSNADVRSKPSLGCISTLRFLRTFFLHDRLFDYTRTWCISSPLLQRCL